MNSDLTSQATTTAELIHGEHPSHSLLVKNVQFYSENELISLFKTFGEIKSLNMEAHQQNFITLTYYDIRAAKSAQKNLHNVKKQNNAALEVHFFFPKSQLSDMNQGTLVVFNLNASITRQELYKIFGKFGEIKEIRETPNKKHHRFIEFYDIRNAEKALNELNKSIVQGKKIKIELSRPGGARKGQTESLAEAIVKDSIRSFSENLHPNENLQSVSDPFVLFDEQIPKEGDREQLSEWEVEALPFVPRGSKSTSPHFQTTSSLILSNNINFDSHLNNGLIQPFNQQQNQQQLQMQLQTQPLQSQSVQHSFGYLLPTHSNSNTHISHMSSTFPSHHTSVTPSALSNEQTDLNMAKAALGYIGRARSESSFNTTRNPLDFADWREELIKKSSLATIRKSTTHSDLDTDSLSQSSGDSFADFPLHDPFLNFTSPSLSLQHSNYITSPHSHTTSPRPLSLPEITFSQNVVNSEPKPHFDEPDLIRNASFASSLNSNIAVNTSANTGLFNAQTHSFTSAPNLFPPSTLGSLEATARSSSMIFSSPNSQNCNGEYSYSHFGNDVGSISQSIFNASQTTNQIQRFPRSLVANSVPITISNRQKQLLPKDAKMKKSESRFVIDPNVLANMNLTNSRVDTRTTLMIRNIPNKYTQRMLLSLIDANHKLNYNFFYLPIDFKNKCNVGYAFINMTNVNNILPFYYQFHQKKWEKFNSEKICEITYARLQGLEQLIIHFRNSSLLSEDEKVRPVILINDRPEPFPVNVTLRINRTNDGQEYVTCSLAGGV